MKNDKAVMPQSGKKKNTPASEATGNNTKKNKTGTTGSEAVTSATEKTKAKAGRGLANEGTVVSYEEER